ncbi:unnamed protein product [Meloidogyne enterolobii]|uniref:Uncharacterized protein n=1 Tax=Meloidogyne enterolobii TaxID=390850 RepID=A0ACB1A198_MELEN
MFVILQILENTYVCGQMEEIKIKIGECLLKYVFSIRIYIVIFIDDDSTSQHKSIPSDHF